MSESDTEIGHQSEEDRAAAGNEIALMSDLDGLTEERLWEVANECPVEELASMWCVPCRALEILTDGVVDNAPPPEQSYEPYDSPVDDVPGPTPLEIFRSLVHQLDEAVVTLLEGPPIPPPNVTLEELALLVVASRNWLKMVDVQIQQGFTLEPNQDQLRESVTALIGRLSK